MWRLGSVLELATRRLGRDKLIFRSMSLQNVNPWSGVDEHKAEGVVVACVDEAHASPVLLTR